MLKQLKLNAVASRNAGIKFSLNERDRLLERELGSVAHEAVREQIIQIGDNHSFSLADLIFLGIKASKHGSILNYSKD